MALDDQLLNLAAAKIQLVPAGISTHYLLERDGFVCLVEKRGGGFGSIGSVCKLMDDGFAVVTFDGSGAWFVAKGAPRVAATAGQVSAFRSFSHDLRAALTPEPTEKQE